MAIIHFILQHRLEFTMHPSNTALFLSVNDNIWAEICTPLFGGEDFDQIYVFVMCSDLCKFSNWAPLHFGDAIRVLISNAPFSNMDMIRFFGCALVTS